MANIYSCPQSIRGIAARITRLNVCGVPLDPMVLNSRIQFAAFTDLTFSPDVEDGADITMKNAAGTICIRDKDCSRLKGFDTTLKFCGIPLPAMEMLLDATLLGQTGSPGTFKGMVLRDSMSNACADPKSLEIWSKNANKAQCGVGATAAYVQHLLPSTSNWEISGDVSFNYENPLEIELTGYAEKNPNWSPSYPGPTFPSYTPSGGNVNATPTGAAPALLPSSIAAPDAWSLADQAAIRAGGPWAMQTVGTLPALNDCGYAGAVSGS